MPSRPNMTTLSPLQEQRASPLFYFAMDSPAREGSQLFAHFESLVGCRNNDDALATLPEFSRILGAFRGEKWRSEGGDPVLKAVRDGVDYEIRQRRQDSDAGIIIAELRDAALDLVLGYIVVSDDRDKKRKVPCNVSRSVLRGLISHMCDSAANMPKDPDG